MAYERLFLCGDSGKPKGIKYPPKTETIPLLLWGEHKNITLKISDLTQKMVSNLPNLYADLLEIATYIYCADQTTLRGGSGVRDVGAKWRRNMRFVIPVRRPAFWSEADVVEALVETMSFLSDDNYEFGFVKLTNLPIVDNYFEFPKEESDFVPDEIIPFSGGVDSLGGAINEILIDEKKTALVSHRSAPKIAPKQKGLYDKIRSCSKKDLKPLHIPVWIQKHGLNAPEDSQRSRSFLYASLSATVAAMFRKNRIRFYENGITSLNLPIAEQVIGARATRTTHPKSVAGFQKLFSLMNNSTFVVEAPFFWKTKTDVIKLIKNSGKAKFIKQSVSCSRVFSMTRLHTHCGCCSQCIERRIAMFAAGCVKYDPDEMYNTDVFIGERQEDKDITLAESYLRLMKEIADMDVMKFYSRFGEISRAIPYINGRSSDEIADKIYELFRRNAEQVRQAILNAIKYYSNVFEAEALPEQCLLRQICGLRVPPVKDELVTLTEAAEILGKDKGTISRYADSGQIKDNGIKGKKRKVWKSSVLFFKQRLEDEQLYRDIRELRKDSKQISDTH